MFLNSNCHVSEGRSLKYDKSKSSSRFPHNILASTPGNSIPLLYTDAAVLFPTQYYHQQPDNTVTDALQAPLFNQKQSDYFNFAYMENHNDLLHQTQTFYNQKSFDNFNKGCFESKIPRSIRKNGSQLHQTVQNCSLINLIHVYVLMSWQRYCQKNQQHFS